MANDLSTTPETGEIGRGYLIRYRVLAFTTAILLIIVVFVGIPLQVAAGRPQVVNVVGTAHGILYLVYLVVAYQLASRLGMPRWRLALVLLAGTVPFCAFIAERKLTHRFDARIELESAIPNPESSPALSRRSAVRRRWLSRRAMLFHLEVAIVAPGCIAAGWWQATRALAGNGLSWLYSVEWPLFAVLAIGGWWTLIHEDPDELRARKQDVGPLAAPKEGADSSDLARSTSRPENFDEATARRATWLAIAVGADLALGAATTVLVPPSRPSGLIPDKWAAVFIVHALLGIAIAAGAVVFVARVRRSSRISKLSGWIGVTGVALAGLGGMLTITHPLRLAGMIIMFLGTLLAGFGYLFPTFDRLEG
jgi:integral membrane protein